MDHRSTPGEPVLAGVVACQRSVARAASRVASARIPRRRGLRGSSRVVTLRASYARWYAVATALLAGLTEAERAAVLGGNAEKLYLSQRGRI